MCNPGGDGDRLFHHTFWNMGLKKSLKRYISLHTSQIHLFTILRDDARRKQEMHPFNGKPGIQFKWGDDQEPPEYFASAFRQDPAVVGDLGNQRFLSSGLNNPGGIYEAADFAPGLPLIRCTSDNIYSGRLADEQISGVVLPGRMTTAPEHTIYGPEVPYAWSATVAVPASDPAFPYVRTTGSFNIQSTPPFSQPPPSRGSPLHHSASWQSSSSTASQYANHNSLSGAFESRPAIPSSRSGIVTTGPGHKHTPTGLLSLSAVTGAVQPSPLDAHPLPVTRTSPLRSFEHRLKERTSTCTATTLQTRGERWDQLACFLCMCGYFGTLCGAQITGDRKSVTNHLRDVHGFTCDGRMTRCPWGGCKMEMQRRNIPRHIVTCHLAVKVHCPGCGLQLSRKDAEKKHRQACPHAKQAASVVVEGDEEDAVCLSEVSSQRRLEFLGAQS